MLFDFNNGYNTLALKRPTKPVQVDAPDAKNLFLHEGEDSTQYNSFIDAVSDMAQMFKFLPKSDQMRYQYGDALYLLGKDNDAVSKYVDALVEFEADPVKKAEVLGWKNIFLDNTKTVEERRAAKESIQAYADALFAAGYSAQLDPANQNNIWGSGMGQAYSNLEFSPDASSWDLVKDDITDNTLEDVSVLDDINTWFSSEWTDFIKSFGEGSSYYQIAKTGVRGADGKLGTSDDYSNADAFYLMCSMLESRERVMGRLYQIFGDSEGLAGGVDVKGGIEGGSNGVDDVIDNISTWLASYTDVDPHNIGIMKMFFSMQTDFINTLDAYINCQTYWGKDFTASNDSMGLFSSDLFSKVDDYITGLTDPGKKAAAENLMAMWFNLNEAGEATANDRWDRIGEEWTGDVLAAENNWMTNVSGTWVEFFVDAMDKFNYDEVCRIVVTRIMNRGKERDYKTDMKEYEGKVENMREGERANQKAAANRKAADRKVFSRLIARRSAASKSRRKARKGAIKGAYKPFAKPKPKPVAVPKNKAAARPIISSKKPVTAASNNAAAARSHAPKQSMVHPNAPKKVI